MKKKLGFDFIWYTVLSIFFYLCVLTTRLSDLNQFNIIIVVTATIILVLGLALRLVDELFTEEKKQQYSRLLSSFRGMHLGFVLIFIVTLIISIFAK